MKTIWNRQTGEAMHYDSVDAREVLNSNPDLYTPVDPDPPAEDAPLAPQNVADVENEYRREPVEENPLEQLIQRARPIIRNATGAPRLR